MDGDADVAHDTPPVVVRYWAAARAAAGREHDEVRAGTLARVLDQARALHPDDRFARVVASCSVLVGDRPVNRSDPGAVDVAPGATVELLPPFAGGAR